MKRFPWREVAVGVCIAVSVASLGAAIDVRDTGKANTAEIKRVDDVQTERYNLILTRINDLRDDLRKGDLRKGTP